MSQNDKMSQVNQTVSLWGKFLSDAKNIVINLCINYEGRSFINSQMEVSQNFQISHHDPDHAKFEGSFIIVSLAPDMLHLHIKH